MRAGGRKHVVNLSPFLPHDRRNIAVGRRNDSYDTVIMFRKNALITEHEMLLPRNGMVATTHTLTSELFQLIYVAPGGNYDKRWVLYDPDISDRIPTGYTLTEDDPALRPDYYRSTNRVWENARIVANDSYACPYPNCSCFNPKGFTACVTCGCKFTFEIITGPSKVAPPSDDTAVDDEEVTPEEFAAYGRRIAACTIRVTQGRAHVPTDEGLLWHQIHRCLDWRRKWDYEWSRDYNLEKLRKGGSRWQSGEHWDKQIPSAFEGMKRTPPEGIPGLAAFRVKHDDSIGEPTHPDHSL